MHLRAPSPEGATISYPSELAKYPESFARIFAFLFLACSSSSKIKIPDPPAITNPSLFLSYGREACVGVSLNFEESAPIASNKLEELQCSSSPPPAIIISCCPDLIKSAP